MNYTDLNHRNYDYHSKIKNEQSKIYAKNFSR